MSHVDWSKKPAHAHYFNAQSTEKEGHRHMVDGFTFSVNGSNDDKHVHHYTGLTSFVNGHYHRFYGKTGPAIKLEDGSHYHKFSGRVYFNYSDPEQVEFGGVVYSPSAEKEVHDHTYEGETGTGIGYFPDDW